MCFNIHHPCPVLFSCRNDATSRLCTRYSQPFIFKWFDYILRKKRYFIQIFSKNMYKFYYLTGKTLETLIDMLHIINFRYKLSPFNKIVLFVKWIHCYPTLNCDAFHNIQCVHRVWTCWNKYIYTYILDNICELHHLTNDRSVA
jgi:hypothetical protein